MSSLVRKDPMLLYDNSNPNAHSKHVEQLCLCFINHIPHTECIIYRSLLFQADGQLFTGKSLQGRKGVPRIFRIQEIRILR